LIFTKGSIEPNLVLRWQTAGFSTRRQTQNKPTMTFPDILECWRNYKNERVYQTPGSSAGKTAVADENEEFNLRRDINVVYDCSGRRNSADGA